MKLRIIIKKNKRSKARHRTVNLDFNKVLQIHDELYDGPYTMYKIAYTLRHMYGKQLTETVYHRDAEKAAIEIFSAIKLLQLA